LINKKQKPIDVVITKYPPLPVEKKPVKRMVMTYHPRKGYIKKEVIE
jgi:hypothetical protein